MPDTHRPTDFADALGGYQTPNFRDRGSPIPYFGGPRTPFIGGFTGRRVDASTHAGIRRYEHPRPATAVLRIGVFGGCPPRRSSPTCTGPRRCHKMTATPAT